jgi:hypothetical protein
MLLIMSLFFPVVIEIIYIYHHKLRTQILDYISILR